MKTQKLNTTLWLLSLLVLVIFTACKNEKDDKNVNIASSPIENAEKEATKKNDLETKDFNPLPFDFQATKPTNGKLKGVVELGASGFNWFLVNIDADKNWELKDAKYGDGDSGIFENDATVESVKIKLQDYIKNLLKTDVEGKNIHFVVSSGAAKEDITKRIISALTDLGYFVNTVTPEEEGQYALSAVLPKEYKDNSFVVDMGSSNTKISYYDNEKIIGLETYGSKYFKKKVDPEVVYKDVKKEISKVPNENRKYCFIIGGVPFKFAKEVREEKERYTILKSPNFYNPEEEKEIGGKNIYQAIVDESGTQTYIFDWDANFTIGFLKSL